MTTTAEERYGRYFTDNRRRAHDADTDGVAAALTKLESHALKFALLRHVCRDPDGHGVLVSEEDVAAGIELADWFANDLNRILAKIGEPPAVTAARRLEERITKAADRNTGKPLTARDLMRNAGSKIYPSSDSATADMKVAVASGRWRWAVHGKAIERVVETPP